MLGISLSDCWVDWRASGYTDSICYDWDCESSSYIAPIIS